jgi:hypothetical protein
MKTIYKYPLNIGITTVKMPTGFRFLAVQEQHGQPCLWAEVEPAKLQLDFEFEVIGTGFTVPEGRTYLGTFQALGGNFVGHVYQVTA